MTDFLPEPAGIEPLGDDDAGPGFDMLAASIRADASELGTFLTVLGRKLADALPGQVECIREKKRFRESDKVIRIELTLDDQRFEVEEGKGSPVATISHVVRGMRLRSDDVALDEWIERLSLKLAEVAEKSAKSRDAISNLLR
jgi:hypothetical protein